MLEVKSSRMARVALTPLVDVVFILLLFFLLTATFKKQTQIEFSTASDNTRHATAIVESVRVVAMADGSVESEGISFVVGGERLLGLMQAWQDNSADLVVSAGADTTVQQLVRVMDYFQFNGMTSMEIAESQPR
ncbi:MAG: biopolymer transporter ExbD [Granulosicoccus sp.]